MSELAFTVNGDAFEVPAAVTAWRVRRLKPRGAPELVYARDGRPLTLSIESDVDDLREAVSASGKYRLDPINDDGRCVDDVPAAYIQVTKEEPRNAASASDRALDSRVDSNAGLAQAVIEAVRLNAEALRHNAEISMRAVDRLPQLMEAMTTMLNVAAGTQLYALQQREVAPALRNRADDVYEDDEDNGAEIEGGDDDGAPPPPSGFPFPIPGFDINKVAGHMAAECMTKMMDRLGAMFGGAKHSAASTVGEARPVSAESQRDQQLAAMQSTAVMQARGGAQVGVQAPPSAPQPSKFATPTSPTSASTPLSARVGDAEVSVPTDSASMMHFQAVRNALSPAEQSEVLAIVQQLTDNERATWFSQLRMLSIPDAIATVRETLVQLADERRKVRAQAQPQTLASPEPRPLT